jgi:flagellar basal body P-ring formation protein FlgA
MLKLAFRVAALMALLLGLRVTATTSAVRVDLHSDRILAGDLAAVIPQMKQAEAGAVLGYAPLPGIERRVSRGELLRWGEDLGLSLDADSLPEAVILARKMRRLESSQVRELVTAAVAERYQVDPAQVEVELHSFSEPLLPAEPLDFELATPLKRLGHPTTLTLRWTDPQGRSGNLSFRATAKVRGTYAVARESLEARTAVSAGDFTFQKGFLPGDPDEYSLSNEEVEGNQLRQSIKAGEVLEKRMIEPALTVKRGDLIELRFRSAAVMLRTAARAEQSGATGEVIRCRNLQSGATVRAVVVDSHQAEVVSFP